MKARWRFRKEDGTTLIEIMVLVAVMGMTAGVLLPAFARPKCRCGHRISCVNNLKNVGLAFRIFSTDNDGAFPWAISTNQGGSKEVPWDAANAWKQFAVISNELSSPKVLACPQDSERNAARNFVSFGNTNLSYFLGLDTDETQPQSILAGDRNLTFSGSPLGPGLISLRASQPMGFSKRMHTNMGNILMGDGSVQQLTSAGFQQALAEAVEASGRASVRLLIP